LQGIQGLTGPIAGSNTQVIFNDNGVSGASSNFTFNKTTSTVQIGGASGTGIGINTNTITGPSEITIDPAGVGDNTGSVRIKGDLFVDGTQTYINSTTIELADFQIGIGTTATSDSILDGAGIGIGSTGSRKTFVWDNTNTSLKSSENLNLATGKTYKIDGTNVLSATTLGTGVTISSLTSVGSLGQLTVTGISTFTNGPVLIGGGTSTGTVGQVLQVTGINSSVYIGGSVGIGTTNPTSKLWVDGSGYFTGILTANRIFSSQYGEFVGGSISGTALVGTSLSISGISTSSEFVGGGSDLRNISGTHLVSYASHSETSNSALSIAGISTYNQVGILTGSHSDDSNDLFGNSVATSGDGKTIIVGVPNDKIGVTTSTGLAYVFDRVGNSFNQVGILTGSLAVDSTDGFGLSLATSVDGKTIIIGVTGDEIGVTTSTGLAYVFDRVGNSFNQVGILTGSYSVDSFDGFGNSVATSADGKTIVVGAYGDEIGITSTTGLAYVFDRIGNSFNQVGILTGSYSVDSNDGFGNSVVTSADGKTIIVGAPGDKIGVTTNTGLVYVFDRMGDSFNQVGILTGSYAASSFDFFGSSVATSADGKTIIVGALSDEIGATGLVYVFDRMDDSFNQVGILTGSYADSSFDFFGSSVATSADGKTIVVGARQGENPNAGIVCIFKRQGNSFNQVGILTGSYAFESYDNFGQVVTISADGKTIFVEVQSDGINALISTGIVYVFDEVKDTYVYSGPTGNIGIGTTNPQQKLWVEGNGYFTGILTANRIFSSTYGEFVGGSISGTAIVGTSLSISGISTLGTVQIASGIVTSTNSGIVTYFGDGSNLTGTGVQINKNDVLVGSDIRTINFTGSGISSVTASAAGISTVTIPGTSKSVTYATATANQTSFSATYSVGFVDVFMNGVKLSDSSYTAINGTTIVLNEGASLGDVIEIIGYVITTPTYNITVSTSSPSGGANGDIWIKYTA
jgi:hypothetical protein